MGLLSSIAKIGGSIIGASGGSKSAKNAAQATEVRPYGGTSALGDVTYNNAARTFNIGADPNPFTQLLNLLGPAALSNAAAAPGSAYYGAPRELVQAAQGLSMGAQQADASSRYNLLTRLAQPEYQRTFNTLNNALFSRGQLGSTGGAEQFRAFHEAQNDADLKRQLASQDWASQQAMNRFTTAQNAIGTGATLQNQNYNIGSGAFQGVQNLFSALGNLANTGVASGGGQNAQAAINAAQAANGVPAAIYGAVQSSGILDSLKGLLGGGSRLTEDMLQPVQVTSRYI